LGKVEKVLHVKDAEQLMFVLSAIIIAIAVMLALWFFVTPRKTDLGRSLKETRSDKGTENTGSCALRRFIDGVCVGNIGAQSPQLVAVMVENHVDAQPLSGIAKASLVYEAPVEGSIPRLMAIFPSFQEAEKVGPVRSARPYYLDWLLEYPSTMYMHVGGSPEALAKIQKESIFDMNEFSRGWYYWRATDRFAPHNAYTSSNLWNAALERYADVDAPHEFESWHFSDDIDMCETDCDQTISLSYGGGGYKPSWKYNGETGVYDRYEFRRVDADQDGEEIHADTVIVQLVTARVVDDVGRLNIDTIGSGKAVIFQGGQAIEGTWEKEELRERTKWLDDTGEQISFHPGKIWVQVVSQFNSVEW